MTNCLLAGVGGQGTILASKLIAVAAMHQGLDVRTAETIGMAQRGGSVVSHVRMGDDIYAPLISLGSADIIIGFEPAEAVRLLDYRKENGVMIVCDAPIKPVTSAKDSSYQGEQMTAFLKENVEKLTLISGKKLVEQCKTLKILNVALLGAAVESGVFPFQQEDLIFAIHELLNPKFWEINISAIEIGRGMYHG